MKIFLKELKIKIGIKKLIYFQFKIIKCKTRFVIT